MTNFTALGKTIKVLFGELPPRIVVAPTATLGSAPLLQSRVAGCEQDDMPAIYFDWEDDNAAVFLERRKTRNTQFCDLDPLFNHPISVKHLY